MTELTQRTKWQRNGPHELKVDDLIVLREDNSPPLRWPLGRVVEVCSGKDGIVRVVVVRTATGTYKRAVKNVALLPVVRDTL